MGSIRRRCCSFSVMPDSLIVKNITSFFISSFLQKQGLSVITLEPYVQGHCMTLCNVFPVRRHHQKWWVAAERSLGSALQVKSSDRGHYLTEVASFPNLFTANDYISKFPQVLYILTTSLFPWFLFPMQATCLFVSYLSLMFPHTQKNWSKPNGIGMMLSKWRPLWL